MAGDWIKMSTGLRTHPKVKRMARSTKSDKLRIVGALHVAWCIFDEHSEDGFLSGYTLEDIDDETFRGFAKALVEVEWLVPEADGLHVPRFDTHNGASAKRRAQDTERKRNDRGQKPDAKRTETGQVSASEADETRTREEKRREEKEPNTTQAATELAITRPTAIAVLLRPLGLTTTGNHPTVRAWAETGHTDETLLLALSIAKKRRADAGDPNPVNPGYLDAILNDPAAMAGGTRQDAKPVDRWWTSNEGIDRKGRELRMQARGGEDYSSYAERIRQRLSEGAAHAA